MTPIKAALTGQEMSSVISTVLQSVMDNTARSEQKDAGVLGFSDLGFCENKAVLVTKQVPPSDPRNKLWSAIVGGAVHEVVERAFGEVFDDWLIERTVTTRFPNGATMSGKPDCIAPTLNSIVELKTKDGFVRLAREGVSRNHRFQTYAAALGAIQEGILNAAEPIHLYWVYFDRAGNEGKPWVEHEEYDPSVIDEVTQWIDNVIQARIHGDEGMKEVAPSICEVICEQYGNCRGGALPMSTSELLNDPEVLNAVEMIEEAKTLEKAARGLRSEGGKVLLGLNGATPVVPTLGQAYQVRTTFIPESDVAATRRKGYEKLEVKPIRRTHDDQG